MKTFAESIISILVFLFYFSVSGQVQKTQLKLISNTGFITGADSIVKAFVDEGNGKYVLWFMNDSPSGFESGIYDMNGNRYLLHKWENLVKYKNDTLCGQVISHGSKTVLYQYLLTKELAQIKESVVMETPGIEPLNSGSYILANGEEGLSTQLYVLGEDLKKLFAVNTGYPSFNVRYPYEYNDKLLINVSKYNDNISDSTEYKFMWLHSSKGKYVKQIIKKFGSNQQADAFINDENLYIGTYNFIKNTPEIEAIGPDGKTMWRVRAPLSSQQLKLSGDGKTAILPGVDFLTSLSLSKGTVMWKLGSETIKSSIIQKFPLEKSIDHLVINNLTIVENNKKQELIVACISGYPEANTSQQQIKSNYLCLVNPEGNIRDIVDCGRMSRMSKVFNVRGELWVLNEKNLIRYEIIKN